MVCPVRPSALIWRMPFSNPHTAIEAAAIENRTLGDGQFDPPAQHRAGEMAVADEHDIPGFHVFQGQRDRRVGAVGHLDGRLAARGFMVHTVQPGTVSRISGVVRPS